MYDIEEHFDQGPMARDRCKCLRATRNRFQKVADSKLLHRLRFYPSGCPEWIFFFHFCIKVRTGKNAFIVGFRPRQAHVQALTGSSSSSSSSSSRNWCEGQAEIANSEGGGSAGQRAWDIESILRTDQANIVAMTRQKSGFKMQQLNVLTIFSVLDWANQTA
jgi:hypothetical protein